MIPAAMFIDTIPNRKSPPAVLLRESYREGGRVKKRTLANLSKLPQSLIDGIGALLDGGKVSGKRAAEPGFEIVRSLPHGHVAAVKAMIGKLGLERTLQGRSGVDKRVRNLIEAMIIQRIIAPGSKLAFHRALAPLTATSSLALSVGLIDVAEREVYAALDWLIEQQARIEAALAQRHLADGTLVLYDVSSSYMEGRCCALAKPGYSRDHRPDRPQIVYGLMCAPDGTPVAVEVFEGNTSDPQTIREQIDKIKRRFKLSHVALVGDRGMVTSARISEELAPAGLDWISCLRAPQIAALANDTGPLQLSLFDERDLAEITSPDFPGERLVACRNPALAEERARKREELLQATERRLTRLAHAVRRKRAKHDAGVIGLCGRSRDRQIQDEEALRARYCRRPLYVPPQAGGDRSRGTARRHLCDPHQSAGGQNRFRGGSGGVQEPGAGRAGLPHAERCRSTAAARAPLARTSRESARVPVHAGLLRRTPHA